MRITPDSGPYCASWLREQWWGGVMVPHWHLVEVSPPHKVFFKFDSKFCQKVNNQWFIKRILWYLFLAIPATGNVSNVLINLETILFPENWVNRSIIKMLDLLRRHQYTCVSSYCWGRTNYVAESCPGQRTRWFIQWCNTWERVSSFFSRASVIKLKMRFVWKFERKRFATIRFTLMFLLVDLTELNSFVPMKHVFCVHPSRSENHLCDSCLKENNPRGDWDTLLTDDKGTTGCNLKQRHKPEI